MGRRPLEGVKALGAGSALWPAAGRCWPSRGTAIPSDWGVFPTPPPQECLQRFGDSLQEMVNYHMVRGPSSFLAPAGPGQPAPLAPRRPRPAWMALRAGSEEAELAGGRSFGGRPLFSLSSLWVAGRHEVLCCVPSEGQTVWRAREVAT